MKYKPCSFHSHLPKNTIMNLLVKGREFTTYFYLSRDIHLPIINTPWQKKSHTILFYTRLRTTSPTFTTTILNCIQFTCFIYTSCNTKTNPLRLVVHISTVEIIHSQNGCLSHKKTWCHDTSALKYIFQTLP